MSQATPLRLTVLHDEACRLCVSARHWLAEQPGYVALEFLGARSARCRERFPGLCEEALLRELHVVADDGRVWRGAPAWVTLLWALREYRSWSLRLASPALLPFAERLVKRISRARHSLGFAAALREVERDGPAAGAGLGA